MTTLCNHLHLQTVIILQKCNLILIQAKSLHLKDVIQILQCDCIKICSSFRFRPICKCNCFDQCYIFTVCTNSKLFSYLKQKITYKKLLNIIKQKKNHFFYVVNLLYDQFETNKIMCTFHCVQASKPHKVQLTTLNLTLHLIHTICLDTLKMLKGTLNSSPWLSRKEICILMGTN